jgi:hypothetical protein
MNGLLDSGWFWIGMAVGFALVTVARWAWPRWRDVRRARAARSRLQRQHQS